MTTDVTNTPTKRRSWRIAVAIVMVTAVAAGLVTFWWLRSGRYLYARSAWQPEPVEFLPSMLASPVKGWTAGLFDLGLPHPPAEEAAPTFAAHTRAADPLIGAVGDHAFFLARSGTHWWLIGIDVRDGQSLFEAVELNVGNRAADCTLNGPTHVVCLDHEPATSAWVIETTSGRVVYQGPSDITPSSGPLTMERLGDFAVATSQGKGIYGIGSHAETTWFIPGDGILREVSWPRSGSEQPQLSSQANADPKVWDSTVFSVHSGSAIRPDLGADADLHNLTVYPGGFAANVTEDREQLGVVFFDDAGREITRTDGRVVGGGSLLGLAIVAPDDADPDATAMVTIFSPDGGRLLTIPDGFMTRIGSTLFHLERGTYEFPEWRQYDLKTGEQGPVCDFPMHRYIGTDGSTLVFQVTNPKAGLLARARDLKTCKELWTLPAQPDSLQRIWRIHTNLIQLSADGTELSSLVPPR